MTDSEAERIWFVQDILENEFVRPEFSLQLLKAGGLLQSTPFPIASLADERGQLSLCGIQLVQQRAPFGGRLSTHQPDLKLNDFFFERALRRWRFGGVDRATPQEVRGRAAPHTLQHTEAQVGIVLLGCESEVTEVDLAHRAHHEAFGIRARRVDQQALHHVCRFFVEGVTE